MNSRLEALVNRGYKKEDVLRLASFTSEELEYASLCAFRHIIRNCTPVINPKAIFIGGQPGCGKTVMSMNLKNEIGNAIEIGIDNYRMYHPRYLEIEKYIREFWKDKKESINDTPGNDIADFTHVFAGAMTDKLIEMGSKIGYNMLLEWGMREPKAPLATMETLKERGYGNSVLFVSTYKDISYQACNLRSDVMKNSSHIIRKVPKNFHDLSVSTLPSSINEIYSQGYDNNLIDYMVLVTRDGKAIWDDKSKELPGNIYREYLNNSGYYNKENDSLMASQINEVEMQGLRENLNDIVEIIAVNPEVFKASKIQ